MAGVKPPMRDGCIHTKNEGIRKELNFFSGIDVMIEVTFRFACIYLTKECVETSR